MDGATLTPICGYNDEADSQHECGRCGRKILYFHVVRTATGVEWECGICCLRKLRDSGEITRKAPRYGRYDWRLAEVRAEAKALWDCHHLRA